MLRTLRLICFLALLMGLGTDSRSKPPTQPHIAIPLASPNHSEATKPDQRGTEQSPFVVKVMPPQETNQPTDKHADGVEITAEDRIADYTRQLTWVTGFLGLVTAGLVYLAWRQEGHFKRAERAYIAVEPQGVIPLVPNDHSVVHVSIKNVGTIPARKVRWIVCEEADGNGRRDSFPIDESKLTGDNVVSAGIVMNYNRNAMLETQLFENIKGGGMYYYVWGVVRYDDGFGVSRFTRFCHRYNRMGYMHIREGIHNGKWGILPEGAKYHQWGNDAD